MVPRLRVRGDAMTSVTLGADTPRSHGIPWDKADDYRHWYREPTPNVLSPCARHEDALTALPDLAYIREWGKQWKTRKPAKRAPKVSEVEALRARVAELEAALNRMYSIMEAA